VNRREAAAALAAMLVAPLTALGQQNGRVPVVGMLITHPPVTDPVVQYLRDGLQHFGYEDGRNIRLEVRTALGKLEQVPVLAQELVRIPSDVIVVVNEVALRACTSITSTIPIVMVGFTDDPVALGWIDSYQRPGRNVTGVFNVNAALSTKRLEILKETLPGISRVAVLWDNFGKRQLQELPQAAQQLSLRILPIEVRSRADLDRVFAAAKRDRVGAVMTTFSPVFWMHRERVAALALKAGLPTVTDMEPMAAAGCLLFYGSDYNANWQRAGYYVDRLLNGAKAAELPVERLSTVKLVVNLKTAKALGVAIPPSILLRADEVIQ
jgi:putative ABC transport system substrate-binding protein